ncbi:hypothetical protein QO034_10865 [Sedimentitalea sp. JM2-8]|uniref:Uncharacterized protein n=1 Tax=Sedimentitalea xiamensis TaxID=3050037 RepID=A0ABT7FES0_9RHOB|nr:hypothetical protein [Sedimentitalea xiamensis]MDK3073613.1 hypothetical protein [Sedimentitalea xiamensis]
MSYANTEALKERTRERVPLQWAATQIEAFDDTGSWGDEAEAAFAEVLRSGNGAAAEMLRAMRSFLGENDMMAILTVITMRLTEL